MLNRIQKYLWAMLALGVLLAPKLTYAVALINPLGTVSDPRMVIAILIQAILSLVGSLALLMFVYGGVIWITSFGEASRVDKGKKIITWAVLGLAMIASAYVLVNAVIKGLTLGTVN